MTRLQVHQGGGEATGPSRAECDAIAAAVIGRLTSDGQATAASVEEVDSELRRLHFHLVEKNQTLLLPGGWQLIYLRDHVSVRIKTVGTQRRPCDHMTVSLTRGGPTWPDEQAKYNGRAQPRPAILLANPIPNMPNIGVLQTGLTGDQQDDWANDTHFDFASGFDRSAAETLQPDVAGG
jgi:hypothetical protein